MAEAIRVLVVDDSAFMRHTITTKLLNEADITIADVARDGFEAVRKVESLRPDVVTMDVEMPRMDGLAALEQIMRTNPCAVIMLSSTTIEGAATTIRALELGAVDFVAKPSGSVSIDISKVREELLSKVRHAARTPLSRLRPFVNRHKVIPSKGPSLHGPARCQKIIVVGSSTGGPKALYEVVPSLPSDMPATMLIIQHMPAGFTKSLAERLNELSQIAVKEAEDGEPLRHGMALMAPGDFHLLVTSAGRVRLDRGPRVHGVRPSVDVTMESLAKFTGAKCLGVVLTGMGTDGTYGARLLRQAGGTVIAEDESTCVVYGMPRSVVETGNADMIVPLPQVSESIASWVRDRTRNDG